MNSSSPSSTTTWQYPATRTVNAESEAAGVTVRDPYRWLESLTSEEVLRWGQAQDSLARTVIERATPAVVRIRERLWALAGSTDCSVPLLAGERSFFLQIAPGKDKPALMVETTVEAARVLVDPNRSAFADDAFLVDFAASPDSRRLAYVLRYSHDQRELRVVDVETEQDLGIAVSGARISRRPWGPASRVLYYALPTGSGNDDTETWQIRARSLGDNTDVHVFEQADLSAQRLQAFVGDDGRFLFVTARGGASGKTRLFVRSLDGGAPGDELLAEAPGRHSLVGNDGEDVLIQTDFEAPNGQLVAVKATAPEARHRSIVPESDAVLEESLRVGDRLLLHYNEQGRSVAKIYDFSGAALHEIELPIGLIWTDHLVGWSGFSGGVEQEVAFFRFLGLSAPRTIFSIDTIDGTLTAWKGYNTVPSDKRYVTRRVEYRSRDGVRIPMYVTHWHDFVPDGTAPVLLYGYGAFGWTARPFFNPKYQYFLERGGVHAMPAVRGGGTYGATWHEAGSGRHKGRTIDDLIAAAEWLLSEGYTTRDKLIIEGNSAGGVAVAGAIMRRPELFGVAIIEVPLTDMARLSVHTSWLNEEFGDHNDPGDVRAMLEYSPYHHVRPGATYPATLVATGDEDRVAPAWHAYKLTAALQAAQSGPGPILLRIDWRTGHGANKPLAKRIAEWADELAFIAWRVGIEVP